MHLLRDAWQLYQFCWYQVDCTEAAGVYCCTHITLWLMQDAMAWLEQHVPSCAGDAPITVSTMGGLPMFTSDAQGIAITSFMSKRYVIVPLALCI